MTGLKKSMIAKSGEVRQLTKRVRATRERIPKMSLETKYVSPL